MRTYSLLDVLIFKSTCTISVNAFLIRGRKIRGETSIEKHINARFREIFKQRKGLLYRNPYDFGFVINWLRFLGLLEKEDQFMDQLITNRRPNILVFLLLFKRFLLRVLIPSWHKPYDDGFHYELSLPSADIVIRSLTESGLN